MPTPEEIGIRIPGSPKPPPPPPAAISGPQAAALACTRGLAAALVAVPGESELALQVYALEIAVIDTTLTHAFSAARESCEGPMKVKPLPPLPVPLAEWELTAPGRQVHIADDGRTILRETLLSGERQYAVFPSSTLACKTLDHGVVPWRLDRKWSTKLAETRL